MIMLVYDNARPSNNHLQCGATNWAPLLDRKFDVICLNNSEFGLWVCSWDDSECALQSHRHNISWQRKIPVWSYTYSFNMPIKQDDFCDASLRCISRRKQARNVISIVKRPLPFNHMNTYYCGMDCWCNSPKSYLCCETTVADLQPVLNLDLDNTSVLNLDLQPAPFAFTPKETTCQYP